MEMNFTLKARENWGEKKDKSRETPQKPGI